MQSRAPEGETSRTEAAESGPRFGGLSTHPVGLGMLALALITNGAQVAVLVIGGLLVAFIWSITANIDKIGVEETSPIYWAFAKDSVILLYLIPILAIKSKKPLLQIYNRKWPLLMVGFFKSASVVTQMFAIQFILVPYVISIKRASSVFIILFAFLYMNERKNFRNRMIGIIIILLGLGVIAVS